MNDDIFNGSEFAGPYLMYSDILYNHTMDGDYSVCILPWGSFEPHGLHLPYMTDSLLASLVAVMATDKTEELKYKFMILPCVNMGSQNPGQTNKKFCIHYSSTTQFNVLVDIVDSLFNQGIKKLVIINGHNGNNFKVIVRDIENMYPDFKIFVCNYLDIIEESKEKFKSVIDFPEIDDHAGFTETSLMMAYLPFFVKEEYLHTQPMKEETTQKIRGMWTPRNWDEISTFTNVGDPSTSSAESGELLMEYVTNIISKSLIDIYKMGD